jgi:transposase-like protein
MQAEGLEWGEGYRGLGRDAIAGILQDQMARAIDDHLDRMAVLDEADRRDGSYRRHLLTELGDIELLAPRTIAVVRVYARRPEQVDRMILSCFVLGLSARQSLPSRKRGWARRCCRSSGGR